MIFENQILNILWHFGSIGDNSVATGYLILEILSKNQQILMKTAFIFDNINPDFSKNSGFKLILSEKINFVLE